MRQLTAAPLPYNVPDEERRTAEQTTQSWRANIEMNLQGLGAQAQADAGGLDSDRPAPRPEDRLDGCEAHQNMLADDLEPPARYATGMPHCTWCCTGTPLTASGSQSWKPDPDACFDEFFMPSRQ